MSWRQRRLAARQRRQAVIDDVRRNGWRRELRNRGERIARIVAQAPKKTVAAGKKAAQHVLSIQRAAGLNRKLVERSALSVIADAEPRHQSPAHTAWVAGYAKEVGRQLPGILPEPEKPPEWYEIGPNGPNRDDTDTDKEDMELQA